jgi:transcriptional regulator with XRE-family HTH domain
MPDIEKRAITLPPSRVVGLRVRETRKDRQWTQERLAQELREVGIRIGQTDVARLEKLPGDKGHDPRSVTLEDWLALAFVLDIPPLALLLPTDEERIAVVPKGVRQRDTERFEIPHPPPADVEPQPRTYSGDWHPVHEPRERTAAWIVGTAPLDGQRGPGRYRSYRQDAQTSAGLGGYLRMLADLVDGEDLDGRRDVIQWAQQYLAGMDRALEMKRRQDLED